MSARAILHLGVVVVLTSFLALSAVAAASQLPVRETFDSGTIGSDWAVDVSDGNKVAVESGSLLIDAVENTFAHIERPIDSDCITVSARMRIDAQPGVSWCPSVFVVWDAGNWCQLGMIAPDGAGQFYCVEAVQGATTETRLTKYDIAEWQHIRIQLGRDCIRYFAGSDGKKWKLLRVIERPPQFAGTPRTAAIGKGFGRGTAPYAGPDLDNNYADKGGRTIARIDVVEIAGTPAGEIRLTAKERETLRQAGLDPVGLVLLKGNADPTYDKVAKFYPAMQKPKDAVGVPEHPLDITVDHLGKLGVNYDQPPVAWLEIGKQHLSFGDKHAKVLRRWMDKSTRALVLTMEREGVIYEQTVFGWSEGFSPDKELYAYVRLRATGGKGAVLPRDAALVSGESRRTELPLANGVDSTSVCLRFRYPDPTTAEVITSDQFDRTLTDISGKWRKTVEPAAIFDLPEKRVDDAYRAWIAYSLLDVDKVNGYCEPRDGIGFYEQIYGYSAALYCMALDMYGLHAQAERYLDTLLHFQQPDGLYLQNFGLPDHGALLVALGEHYKMTGDVEWLRRVSDRIVLAGDWLVRQRKSAPREGVTRGMIKFRSYCDYSEPVYGYFSDTYCCLGLEAAAYTLKEIGRTEESNGFATEAKRYRADLTASMRSAALRIDGHMVLPLEPDTHRLLKDSRFSGGEYYGLVAGCILENGFLAASDDPARWICELVERKNGLIAGLCQFAGGIDHAYTYGYLINQIERDDIRKVLLGFYGMLAYGMTQDTYSGVEVTFVANGDNYWTLPHLYSATQQLRLLRNMLVREDGDVLWLGQAVPRDWLKPGKKVAVTKAPTTFGPVSFDITAKAARTMLVSVDGPSRRTPAEIRLRLRHPDGLKIKGVTILGGKAAVTHSGEDVTLRHLIEPITLEVQF